MKTRNQSAADFGFWLAIVMMIFLIGALSCCGVPKTTAHDEPIGPYHINDPMTDKYRTSIGHQPIR